MAVAAPACGSRRYRATRGCRVSTVPAASGRRRPSQGQSARAGSMTSRPSSRGQLSRVASANAVCRAAATSGGRKARPSRVPTSAKLASKLAPGSAPQEYLGLGVPGPLQGPDGLLQGVVDARRRAAHLRPPAAQAHLLGADGQHSAQRALGAKARAGRGLELTGPRRWPRRTLQRLQELLQTLVVGRPVGAAKVHPGAAGEQRRQLHLADEQGDEALLAGHGAGEHGRILLAHPGALQRARGGDQHAVASACQGLVQFVHQHVARGDVPLVEEDREAGLMQVFGEHPHPLGVRAGIGDEDVKGLRHRRSAPYACSPAGWGTALPGQLTAAAVSAGREKCSSDGHVTSRRGAQSRGG
jgi:hypothetical protein